MLWLGAMPSMEMLCQLLDQNLNKTPADWHRVLFGADSSPVHSRPFANGSSMAIIGCSRKGPQRFAATEENGGFGKGGKIQPKQ